MDGWSDFPTSTHYFAVFACAPSATGRTENYLLAFTPFQDESLLNSEKHSQLIRDTLSLYGKSISNVLFITGDNENLNAKICSDLGVPLIGCYSHRLNLAAEKDIETCALRTLL